MNKAQLIESLADRLGGRRAAGDAVEAVLDTITRTVVKGERVAISGFGIFEKVERKARTARNPRTGASVKVKKTAVPRFKPGQGFKDVVSGAKKLAKAAAPGRATAGAGTAKTAAAARRTGRAAMSNGPSASGGAPARKSTGTRTAAKTATTAPAKANAGKTTAAKTTTAGKATARRGAAATTTGAKRTSPARAAKS